MILRRCLRLTKSLALVLSLGSVISGSYASEHGAIRAFESAKRTDPELMLFFKQMPKGGDLHVHVSGAVYSDYMLDSAIAKGLYFDPATSQFGTDSTKIPAAQLLKNNALLYQFMDAASMRGWMGGGQSGHDHFFATFGIFGNALGARNRLNQLAEVVGRAKAQHEVYMELMASVTPSDANDAYFADLPNSSNMVAALATLRPKLEKLLQASKPYLDEQEKVGPLIGQKSLTGLDNPIAVRYIWSCNRLSSPDTFFAQAAAGIYLAAHEHRIVAMNMVAPEDHPLSRMNFDGQMRMIDFLWHRLGKPNMSLHAGELTPSISPVETMRDRIRKTIDLGHAKRIGHGVDIAWEDDSEDLMAQMKRQGIAVEICLTSNYSILGVSKEQHPLHLYRSHGVPVFLNTDDEGVSRSTLTLEYIRGVREQGLGYLDLKEMSRASIEFSFLKGPSLYNGHDYRHLKSAFSSCRNGSWTPGAEARKALASSEKMRMELKLERAFASFEARFP